MDSTPHPAGRYLVTRPTPPWDPLALGGRDFEHITSYPRRLWDYTYICIFVSIRSITSNPLLSTARMACVNHNPLSSQMFSVQMEIPGGRWGQKRGDGGDMCRRLAP